mmetsp:Transcript_74873/g.206520  ORF Transcript_74873/g.206520 Transcript_74873/m.206520 type:complete len:85 (+) Transcript_74873:937-1191(+)
MVVVCERDSCAPQSESIIVHSSIVCCQVDNGASSKRVSPSDGPISLALTEFHFVLLYSTCIRAISRLNKKVGLFSRRSHPSGFT